MKAAVCPNCGADLVFKDPGAIVRVCDYCRSVIARGDLTYENLGKVGDVATSQSPLAVDLEGTYQGQRFVLTGRVLLAHPAGGTWEEWYAHFHGGWWGWLAEAQGRFYFTFERQCPAPAWELLAVGAGVRLDIGEFMVAEKAEATYRAAAGEIPFRLDPRETYRYADLSAPGGTFATIDYSEATPRVFSGVEVTLADLGLADRAAAERAPETIKAVRLACPNCDGALELRAPDQTQRVGCPYCGMLLDVNQGNLVALKSIANDRPQLTIPLGATGTLAGTSYTVIGYLRRSVEIEGTRYPWEEWLLYQPAAGFRWLVCSDGHWSFVEPVPPGSVVEDGRGARHGDGRYRPFSRAKAQVDQVLGELYWKVEAGETTEVADYVAPPRMLSWEWTTDGKSEEINWSLGTYLTPAEVRAAFKPEALPTPVGVAPNQPWPHGRYAAVWALLIAGILLLGILSWAIVPTTNVMHAVAEFPALPAASGTSVWFSEPFALRGGKNVVVHLGNSRLANAWWYAQGDLVNTDTGLVIDFGTELEYYDGEGDYSEDRFLSAVPAGNYALRLEAQWSQWEQPQTVDIAIQQGRVRLRDFLIVGGIVLGAGFLFLWARSAFERRRWQNSDFAPRTTFSASAGEGDDE